MQPRVQLGTGTLILAQSGVPPIFGSGSLRHARSGADTPTFPTLSTARAARQTQPFLTPNADGCNWLKHSPPVGGRAYTTGSGAALTLTLSCWMTLSRSITCCRATVARRFVARVALVRDRRAAHVVRGTRQVRRTCKAGASSISSPCPGGPLVREGLFGVTLEVDCHAVLVDAAVVNRRL